MSATAETPPELTDMGEHRVTANFGRVIAAQEQVIGGEHRMMVTTDSGVRFSVLFDSQRAASYAVAGLRGAIGLDKQIKEFPIE